jgi:hypothetical protein
LNSKADQEEADESHMAINENSIAIITRDVMKVGSGSDSKQGNRFRCHWGNKQ